MSKLSEIEKHVADGKIILAIKELRSSSGLGLKEAKQAVDAYRASSSWPDRILTALGLSPRTDDQGEPAATGLSGREFPAEKLTEIQYYCAKGQKIQAIKAMRMVTGLGLRDAKDAVDHYFAARNWDHPVLRDWDMGRRDTPESGNLALALPSRAIKKSPATESQPAAKKSPRQASPFAPAVAALEAHLGRPVEARLVVAAEYMLRPGHLVFIGDKACFVCDEYGRWRVEPIIPYGDVTEVEVRTAFGVELDVKVGFMRERFSKLDESDAEAALALLRAFAS